MGYFDNIKKSFGIEFVYFLIFYIIIRFIIEYISNKNYIFFIITNIILIIGISVYTYYKDKDICNKDPKDDKNNYSILNPIYKGTFYLYFVILFSIICLTLGRFPLAGLVCKIINKIPLGRYIIGFILIYIIYELITAATIIESCLNPPGINLLKNKTYSTSLIVIIYLIVISIFFYFPLLNKYVMSENNLFGNQYGSSLYNYYPNYYPNYGYGGYYHRYL